MEHKANNGAFRDELWGAEDANMRLANCCSDATDESDFTPAELAMMTRKGSNKTAPLPKGVKDIQWQPPVATGLDNSDAIFQTEADERGVLLLSGEGISENNSHFRSWQEDNGTAKSFGSKKIEREVDGKTIIVSVAKKTSSTTATRPVRAKPRTDTMFVRPTSADAVLQGGSTLPSETFAPDVRKLKALRNCFSEEEYDSDDLEYAGKGQGESSSIEEGSTGQSLRSADMPSQQTSATTRGLAAAEEEEEEAVRDSLPGCCAQPPGERTTPALEVVDGRPSLSTTVASDRVMPAMPHRPPNGVVSSHAQESPRGQRLSEQGDVGCVGASTLPEQEEGAEVARQPSPVVASGGDIICESGVGKPSSGTAPGSGIGGGRTGIAGSLQDEQRQEGDDASNGLLCDGSKEALNSTPSPEIKARKTWWGGLRNSTATVPSPQAPQSRQRFTIRLPGHRQRSVAPP